MDGATLALIAPMIAAAISALFWGYVRDKDKQIAEKQTRIDKLEAEVTALNQTLDKNTDALGKAATSQEQVVTMLRDLLGEPSRTGNRPPTA